MRLHTIMMMAGDGSSDRPRKPTSIFVSLDQWATLVRDSFTCKDRNGVEQPDRVATMPTVWTLVQDLGPIGIVSMDLDPSVQAAALAKFGYGDSTAVVGRTVAELRTQAIARRAEAISALPGAITSADQVRTWLGQQTPANVNVEKFRVWLINIMDGVPTTPLPLFFLNNATADDSDLNWRAVANFADFLDTANLTMKTIVRVTEIVFLTIFISGTA